MLCGEFCDDKQQNSQRCRVTVFGEKARSPEPELKTLLEQLELKLKRKPRSRLESTEIAARTA